MKNKIDALLYELLISEKIIDQKVLDKIVKKHAKESADTWVQELVADHGVDGSKVMELFSKELGLEYVSLKNIIIDEKILKKVPIKVASHYQFIPLSLEDATLRIAVYYPKDIKVQDEIRFQLGYDVDQVLANKDEVIELLRTSYGFGAQAIEEMFIKGDASVLADRLAGATKVEDLEKTGEDATVSNLVNQIILDAHKKRATDIHIEPYRGNVRFRYRIDGKLYDAKVSDQIKHFIAPILSRIKIMSNLDIVEHRLPQDGQAVVKTQYETVDLRVSFIPSIYGESVLILLIQQQ
jgi:type IV pilus assembly protein PilB